MAMAGSDFVSWCDHDEHDCQDRYDSHAGEDLEHHAHSHSHGPFEHSHDATPCQHDHGNDISALIDWSVARESEIAPARHTATCSPDIFSNSAHRVNGSIAISTRVHPSFPHSKFAHRATLLMTERWLS